MDSVDEVWDGLAGRIAIGELTDEAQVARALAAGGLLDDPHALDRVRTAIERFQDLVHESPGRALGLATLAWVVTGHHGGPPGLLAELCRRQATALFALGRARESADRLEAGLALLRASPDRPGSAGGARPSLPAGLADASVAERSSAAGAELSSAAGAERSSAAGGSSGASSSGAPTAPGAEDPRQAERELGSGEVVRARAALLGFLGNARLGMGQVGKALVALEEAIALARAHGLRPALGVFLSSLGNARLFTGEARAAESYYVDALGIARSSGNREGEAVNLNNLGLVRQALGDHEGALELYQEALALCRQLGDRRSAATVEANLAQALAEQGDLEQATLHQEVALELARASDDRATQAVALVRLAGLARERGALAEAQRRVDEAESALPSPDDPRRAGAWVEAARLRLELGDLPGARDHLSRALARCRGAGDRRGEALALRELGRVERVAGDLERARASLLDARDVTDELEDPDQRALVELALAEVAAGLRQAPRARAHLAAAAPRAERRPGSLLAAQHALASASVLRLESRLDEARALLDELARASRESGHVAVHREAVRRRAAMHGE